MQNNDPKQYLLKGMLVASTLCALLTASMIVEEMLRQLRKQREAVAIALFSAERKSHGFPPMPDAEVRTWVAHLERFKQHSQAAIDAIKRIYSEKQKGAGL